jgi:hypothetical protein
VHFLALSGAVAHMTSRLLFFISLHPFSWGSGIFIFMKIFFLVIVDKNISECFGLRICSGGTFNYWAVSINRSMLERTIKIASQNLH